MTVRVRASRRPARRPGDGLLPLFAALALSLAGCASGAPGPGADRDPADGRADAADAACATLLSTTDEHGYLEPGRHAWADDRELGGFPALAGHLAAVRHEASDCPVFVLSAGDMMQGTAVSNLTRGEAAIAAMNAVGYDAAALGNHEFDWGLDTLAERMAQADFPMLAANVYVEGTHRHPDWARPWTVVEREGVRLGVVGAVTLSTPVTTRPSNVDGLAFRSIAAAMDRYVPAVRAEGVDFVVAVIHAGGRCEEAGGCRGEVVDELRDASRPPDYVVAGHVHGRMETRIKGTPVVLSPSFTSAYGLGRLERRPDGAVERRFLGVRPVTLDVEADTAVARVVESYLATMDGRLERQVAELARPLSKTGQNREFGLGRLIADAQREAAGARVAIMNNGGIRKGLPAGPITYGDLFEVQPFQNRVVRLELSGADLLQALEHAVTADGVTAHVSGVTVRYDTTAPAGARVRSAVLDDGGEIRPGETYAVAVNDFMAEGGDGFEMLTEAREAQDTGIVDLNALVERLRSLPQPVEAPAEPRWISAAGEERGGERPNERALQLASELLSCGSSPSRSVACSSRGSSSHRLAVSAFPAISTGGMSLSGIEVSTPFSGRKAAYAR